MLRELQTDKKIVGVKQLRKALKENSVKMVFLASDGDPAMTEPMAAQCATMDIPIHWVNSMMELGKACGIDVGAASAALLK